jgi:hypothetical protein
MRKKGFIIQNPKDFEVSRKIVDRSSVQNVSLVVSLQQQ